MLKPLYFLQYSSTSFQLFACGWYVQVSAEITALNGVRVFAEIATLSLHVCTGVAALNRAHVYTRIAILNRVHCCRKLFGCK
jgi:hypothetical protein